MGAGARGHSWGAPGTWIREVVAEVRGFEGCRLPWPPAFSGGVGGTEEDETAVKLPALAPNPAPGGPELAAGGSL